MKTINNSSLLVAATIVLLSSVSHATPCTNDVAIPWPDTFQGAADDDCKGDAACIAGQAQANCIALNAVSDTQRDCSAVKVKRQTDSSSGSLECTATELCLIYSDTAVTTLLCLNPDSGDYHDETGGRGNAISRVYTAIDGAVETFTGNATPTLKGGVVTAVRTTTISLTAPGGSVTETVTSTITEGGSPAAASAASTSAAAGSSQGSSSGASSGAQSEDDAAATGSSSNGGVGAQSSTTAASSRSTAAMASSGTQTSAAAEQTGGAIVNRLANGVLSLVAGVPFLVAVL